MKLEQSFEVAAPLEQVWQTLIDVEHVAPCLPGRRRHRPQRRRELQRHVHGEDRADHRLLHRQARDGEHRRGVAHRDHAGPGHRQARPGRRQGDDPLEARAGRRTGDPRRGRHRLPHHRAAGAVRAWRHDRGHLRAAAEGVRQAAPELAGRRSRLPPRSAVDPSRRRDGCAEPAAPRARGSADAPRGGRRLCRAGAGAPAPRQRAGGAGRGSDRGAAEPQRRRRAGRLPPRRSREPPARRQPPGAPAFGAAGAAATGPSRRTSRPAPRR